jgi:hypothetical protein
MSEAHGVPGKETISIATIQDRDNWGRLRVPFYERLIRDWIAQGNDYHGHADAFKLWVGGLGILTERDTDPEANGYSKWKHRIDRAAQKVLTNV